MSNVSRFLPPSNPVSTTKSKIQEIYSRAKNSKPSAVSPPAKANPTDVIQLHVDIQMMAAEAAKRAKDEMEHLKVIEKTTKSPFRSSLPVPVLSPEAMVLLHNHSEDSNFALQAKLKMVLKMYEAVIKAAGELGDYNSLKSAVEKAEEDCAKFREEARVAKHEAAVSKSQLTCLQREFLGFRANFEKLNDDLNAQEDKLRELRSKLKVYESEENTKLEKSNSDLMEELQVDLTQAPDKTSEMIDLLMDSEVGTPACKANKGKRLRKNNKVTKSVSKKQKTTVLSELTSCSPPGNQEALFAEFPDSQLLE